MYIFDIDIGHGEVYSVEADDKWEAIDKLKVAFADNREKFISKHWTIKDKRVAV